MTEVRVPELGDMVAFATVSLWHYTVGDAVKKGADLVELSTDKTVFNLPSPATGKMAEIMVSEGQSAKSGDLIATIS